MASFLIKKYSEMSGEKKVRIALSLSDMVRRIYKDGGNDIKKYYKILQYKSWKIHISLDPSDFSSIIIRPYWQHLSLQGCKYTFTFYQNFTKVNIKMVYVIVSLS